MTGTQANIINQLRKEILFLEGYKHINNNDPFDAGLGFIKYAFPNTSFPLGAVHEFVCSSSEGAAVSSAFMLGIISSIINTNGIALWVCPSRTIFPPALKAYGIEPSKIIFVNVTKSRERLWVIEEALKCNGISAVVGDIQEITFTESRRLQLAVEQSGVTGFILRNSPKNLATACLTRWQVTSLPSKTEDGLQGVGFPRWNVQLLKVRNGQTGSWQLEWKAGRFRHVQRALVSDEVQHKKAG